MRFFLAFCMIFWATLSSAQDSDFGATTKTSTKPVHDVKKKSQQKHLLAWIKTDPKNTLIGNPCMDKVTREMGFEYVIQANGIEGSRSAYFVWLHNLSVNVALFFKNGPFWKARLNKKLKECMAKTGDYAG